MISVIAPERSSRTLGNEDEVERFVRRMLTRHPAVGLAIGVVRGGRLAFFHGHGLADVEQCQPVGVDTVFRIASLTKLFTAVAVMQLVEHGSVDLDAPASDYLRSYRLVAADGRFHPPTVRHLLTHTSGIPEVIRLADLLHPSWGSFGSRPAAGSVAVGEPVPSLAEAYRSGLRYVVEPGTAFAYSNHGFATLGQIVEDVSGLPLHRYLREHAFEPLGLTATDLRRPAGSASPRAAGYEVGDGPPRRVVDREWVTRGASAIASSSADLASFVAALLGGGANEHGSVLHHETLARMFEPSFQPDPRLPGMGLGFFRWSSAGHRIVGHAGRLPGFTAQLLVAPDDRIGAFAITNGANGAPTWMPTEIGQLLHGLIGVPEPSLRTDIPHRPETWSDICGRYVLPPRIGDLRGRLMSGGGVEVLVRRGRPIIRLRIPIPALAKGVPLHPDAETDPFVYRIDLSPLGMGTARIVFGHSADGTRRAMHTDLDNLSLVERS